jgi:uncharacterized protein YndB with AHSA1/START domain
MRTSLLVIVLAALAAGPAARCQTLPPLVNEGEVPAPLGEVWRLLATADGVVEWMVPKADIDLSIGGEYRTHYDADGVLGDAGTIVSEVLAFEPERMLAMRVKKTPADFPFAKAAAATWSVMYLSSCGATCTHLRLVGLGYPDTEEGRAMRAMFEQGNAWTFEELRKHVARGPDGAAE